MVMSKILRNTLKIVFSLTCVFGVFFLLTHFVFNKPAEKVFVYQETDYYSEQLESASSGKLAEYKIGSSKDYSLLRNKILWHYIKPDFAKWNTNDYLSLWSISFDLNDDNEKEIIGIVDSYLCKKESKCFYILQKDKDSYKDIIYFPFNGEFDTLRILKNKTNGFYDLYLLNTKDSDSYSILKYVQWKK